MAAQTTPLATWTEPREAVVPLSRRLWDLDWRVVTPWQLDEEVTVEAGSYDEAAPFIAEHFAGLFKSGGGTFYSEPMGRSKQKFYEQMDFFMFRAGTRTIGVGMAHPLDWSTYYFRSTAILEAYQRRGLWRAALEHIYEELRFAGVARMEGDVSPTNPANLFPLLRDGWLVTGNLSSERWGGLLRVTKYLDPEAETTFRRLFGGVSVPVRGTDEARERERSES